MLRGWISVKDCRHRLPVGIENPNGVAWIVLPLIVLDRPIDSVRDSEVV